MKRMELLQESKSSCRNSAARWRSEIESRFAETPPAPLHRWHIELNPKSLRPFLFGRVPKFKVPNPFKCLPKPSQVLQSFPKSSQIPNPSKIEPKSIQKPSWRPSWTHAVKKIDFERPKVSPYSSGPEERESIPCSVVPLFPLFFPSFFRSLFLSIFGFIFSSFSSIVSHFSRFFFASFFVFDSGSIFRWFSIDFSRSEPLKIVLPPRRNANFDKIDVFASSSKNDQKSIGFRIPKSIKNLSKIDKNRCQKRIRKKRRFRRRFRSIFGSQLEPTSQLNFKNRGFFRHLGPTWTNLGQKGVPRGSERANMRPKGVPREPKWGQKTSWEHQHQSKRPHRTSTGPTQVSQDLLKPGIACKPPFLDLKGEASKANDQEAPKSAQKTSQTVPNPSQMDPPTLPNLLFEPFRHPFFPTPNLH